ncbi:hypothetical protein, partial [Rhodovulum sulfidophilum]|uniref:hypothetical protein n=1 Tax=Rhodovulum sulfidophilum TaxID=35806 RepID=UPI001F39EFC8
MSVIAAFPHASTKASDARSVRVFEVDMELPFEADRALLQKGGLRRDFPFPLQVQATRTISAVPRALKRLMSATRM